MIAQVTVTKSISTSVEVSYNKGADDDKIEQKAHDQAAKVPLTEWSEDDEVYDVERDENDEEG